MLVDVGFWGNYKRDVAQRNFAVVEDDVVYLCDLVPCDPVIDRIEPEDLPGDSDCSRYAPATRIR